MGNLKQIPLRVNLIRRAGIAHSHKPCALPRLEVEREPFPSSHAEKEGVIVDRHLGCPAANRHQARLLADNLPTQLRPVLTFFLSWQETSFFCGAQDGG